MSDAWLGIQSLSVLAGHATNVIECDLGLNFSLEALIVFPEEPVSFVRLEAQVPGYLVIFNVSILVARVTSVMVFGA